MQFFLPSLLFCLSLSLCVTRCQQVLITVTFQPSALSFFLITLFYCVLLLFRLFLHHPVLHLFYHPLCCLPIHIIFLTHSLFTLHCHFYLLFYCLFFFAHSLFQSLCVTPLVGSSVFLCFSLFFSPFNPLAFQLNLVLLSKDHVSVLYNLVL